jgi:hypothetical protein
MKPGYRATTTRVRSACVAALLTLTGCASKAASAGGPVGTVSGSLSGTASGPASTPTYSLAGTAGTSSTATVSSQAGCATGHAQVYYKMGQPPPTALCVHVGTEIVLTLQGSPGYVWTPMTSTVPGIVSVAARTTDGVAAASAATGHALTVGDAELRSAASFSGDPHGPPTLMWSLIVRVVP